MQSITIKTVGNAKFTVDVAPETTVEDFKDIVTKQAPKGFLKAGSFIKKFILRGKTLKPEQTVSSLALTEDDEIVCLAKKNRKKKSSSTSPAKQEETDKAQDDQKEDDTGLPNYKVKQEDVAKLMKMGFPYQMVFVSLRAAKGDPRLACQYLIAGGIPAAAAARLHKEEEALRQKMVKEGVIPEDFKPESMTTPAPEAKPETKPVGPNGLDARFEALLGNKDALTEVMGNSQVQQQCMEMLGVENPELFKRFMEDPDKVGETDEFAQAMFKIMHKAMAHKPQRRTIKLTEEDRENLQKLQDQCHVDRKQAATVYVGNGKDFERSKAYLDDLLARATTTIAGAPAGPASPRAAASSRNEASLSLSAGAEKMVEPKQETENEDATTLTISPDMLLDDDE